MQFNLTQISGIVAILLTVLLAIYFIQTRKQKTGNNFFFAGMLLVYATMTLCSLILSSGINRDLFLLAHIGNQSIFLIGPALYFYVASHLGPQKNLLKKSVLHALPFFTASLYLSIKFYIYPMPISCRSNHIMLGSIAFAHSLVYFTYTAHTLRQHSKNETKLDDERKKWLQYIVFGCFSTWLIKMVFFVSWDISGFYNGCNEIVNLYFLVSFILLTSFTYGILLKPQLFQEIKKYKHSALNSDDKQAHKTQLLQLLENEKVYKNPLLSLDLLAKKLSIPSRYLSQIINETMGKTYYELVNYYRIKECMEQLSDPRVNSTTILEIAYAAGFNSKSTFNSSFVKHAGTTPKEFRKKALASQKRKHDFALN